MRRLILIAPLLAGGIFASALQTTDSRKRECDLALSKFEQKLPSYSPEVRSQAAFYRGLLRDFYLNRDELTASEGELAETLLGDLGVGAIRSRGEFSPTVAAASPKPGRPSLPLPPKAKARVAKISGLGRKPVFRTGYSAAGEAGGVGYVTITVANRTKRIVEVPGTKSLDARSRAAKIAERLRTVSTANPLWWMKLAIGRSNGQVVLQASGSGAPYIITADTTFAKLWGETPEGLARRLRRNIRHTYDERTATGVIGRGNDPHDNAIEARQAGDALFEGSPDQATEQYRAAIDLDPAYLQPYLRLAQLYRKQGRREEALGVLREAEQAEGMSEEDRRTARAAIGG